MTDYDCKPRNFCWKLNKEEKEGTCLEKFSAPDGTKLMWNNELYPEVNKTSIYTHGQYCQSGLAHRMDDDNDKAECVTIDEVTLNYINPNKTAIFQQSLFCDPHNETTCIYKKNGKDYFKLNCECGLDANKGYCPIPRENEIKEYTYWMKKMWLGDNCHTLDRHSLKAQLECGIGLNAQVLENVATTKMKIDFYPMQVNSTNKDCLNDFVHESVTNLFSGAHTYLMPILSMIFSLGIIYN